MPKRALLDVKELHWSALASSMATVALSREELAPSVLCARTYVLDGLLVRGPFLLPYHARALCLRGFRLGVIERLWQGQVLPSALGVIEGEAHDRIYAIAPDLFSKPPLEPTLRPLHELLSDEPALFLVEVAQQVARHLLHRFVLGAMAGPLERIVVSMGSFRCWDASEAWRLTLDPPRRSLSGLLPMLLPNPIDRGDPSLALLAEGIMAHREALLGAMEGLWVSLADGSVEQVAERFLVAGEFSIERAIARLDALQSALERGEMGL